MKDAPKGAEDANIDEEEKVDDGQNQEVDGNNTAKKPEKRAGKNSLDSKL